MAKQTQERVEGPTPSGGAYAIVHYQDVDKAPCDKADAVYAEAIEYAEDGRPIAMSFLELSDDEEEEEE